MTVGQSLAGVVGGVDVRLARVYEIATHRDLWLVILTAGFAVFLAHITPFAVVLREDAYNFAVKGMEISNGDFSLDRPQALGWPLLLGLVYSLLGADHIFEAMYLARWTSIVCTALAALALGKAASVLFPGRTQRGLGVAVVAAFVTTPLVYSMARSAMSEALFTLCAIGVAYFAARALKGTAPDLRSLVVAAMLAAASYYVRPNGLFVFAALLLATALHGWRSPKALIVACTAVCVVFVAVTSPYLYARHAAFGSPFDYGPNSKYFVETYEHVWAENIDSPSLWEYLRTHSAAEHYDRFFDRGLLAVLEGISASMMETYWVVLALLGALSIFVFRIRRAYIVPLILIFSVAGLSIVYAIFGTVRHLFYLLPFLLLGAGAAAYALERYRVPVQSIAATALILLVASDPPNVVFMGPDQRRLPQVQDHWAVWAANNLNGTVAIVEGGDLIKMSQHYERTGWRIPRPFDRVEPHIRVWRPGIHETMEDALGQFKAKGVRYVITDRGNVKRRTYLRAVSDPRWRDHFIHLGYFHLGGKGSVLPRVNIYEVVY